MLELTYLAATSRLDRLGIRERQVLRLIALGQSESAIAAQLGLSPETTAALCSGVFRTLGLRPTPYLSKRLLAVLTLRQSELDRSSRSRPVGGRCDANGWPVLTQDGPPAFPFSARAPRSAPSPSSRAG
ncbi:LuxR C-terminal-related transcriptional regulator [Nocardioides kongjuensis]